MQGLGKCPKGEGGLKRELKPSRRLAFFFFFSMTILLSSDVEETVFHLSRVCRRDIYGKAVSCAVGGRDAPSPIMKPDITQGCLPRVEAHVEPGRGYGAPRRGKTRIDL